MLPAEGRDAPEGLSTVTQRSSWASEGPGGCQGRLSKLRYTGNVAQVPATYPVAETQDLCARCGGALATPCSYDWMLEHCSFHYPRDKKWEKKQKEAKIEGTYSHSPKPYPPGFFPVALGLPHSQSRASFQECTTARGCLSFTSEPLLSRELPGSFPFQRKTG